MQIGEKSAAAMSMCARLPYCHLCLLEDILNDYTPESEREQEAYAGGYGADWLENVGESVRVYATECENEGKRPTFAGLIRHLKSLHDEGGGEI